MSVSHLASIDHHDAPTWVHLYFAVVFAGLMLWGTGLIGNGDVWFSPWHTQRMQTDALLAGQFALSDDPTDLDWDYAWSAGGVQQVWGLGVPFWRLPWQGLARLAGFTGFPDHAAFGLFMVLVGYTLLRTCNRFANCVLGMRGWLLLIVICVIVLGFPPFLSMLRARFAMYEETIAYGYLFAILQAAMLLGLIMHPSRRGWWSLCAVAGIGGFIRPTLLFYGAASVLCGAILMLPARRLRERDQWTSLLRTHGIGLGLFCLGGGLLWLTNVVRFGNGFEFGHQLNLQTSPDSMYATRFDHPLQDEPLGRAARELFGVLFLPKALNGEHHFASGIFAGQSTTARWREFAFDTYHCGHLLILVTGWALAVRSLFTCFRKRLWGSAEVDLDNEQVVMARVCALLGLWSWVVSVMLALLYLRLPWITSRYTLDFGAAFSVAIMLAAIGFLRTPCSTPTFLVMITLVFSSWLADTFTKGSTRYTAPQAAEYQYVTSLRKTEAEGWKEPLRRSAVSIGDAYSGIPFDREGWEQANGHLGSMFVLFVENPEFLELEIERKDDSNSIAAPTDFRAKIGLEPLTRESIVPTEQGWIIRFRGPQQRRYQQGLQSTFVATVPKSELTVTETPWILKTARWRGLAAQHGSELSNPLPQTLLECRCERTPHRDHQNVSHPWCVDASL